MSTHLAWLIPALIAIWSRHAFNLLVRHSNLVREGWSGVDVQLLRRHDLVPRLQAVVAGHSAYERGLLRELTDLRATGLSRRVSSTELQEAENALSDRLRSILAVAEAYPTLRASQGFLDLQQQLADVEDHIQSARRYYNGAVRDYNTVRESFPNNLIAATFGFGPEAYFEVETATARQVPPVHA